MIVSFYDVLTANNAEYSSVLEGLSALTTQDTVVEVFSTPPQLDGELVTLTHLPRSRWQTLLHLDVIQVSSGIHKLGPPISNKQFAAT